MGSQYLLVIYLSVTENPRMPKDSPIVAARRIRLREWIDMYYGGKQADFVRATGINQGELSGLLRHKSFREEKAANIEAVAKMPDGYLQRPESGPPSRPEIGSSSDAAVAEAPASYEADPSAAIERLRSDIDSLRQVVGLLSLALVHNVPDAIERVADELRQAHHGLPIDRNFLAKYLQRVDNALAARRASVGPQHPESIPTSGAAPRP